MKKIGADAFSGCTSMVSLKADPIDPPVCGSKALYDINKEKCTLYVKSNSIDKYKVADQWKDFFHIESSSIKDVPVDAKPDDCFNVFNISGQLIKSNVDFTELQQLPAGLYIINGKKVLER